MQSTADPPAGRCGGVRPGRNRFPFRGHENPPASSAVVKDELEATGSALVGPHLRKGIGERTPHLLRRSSIL